MKAIDSFYVRVYFSPVTGVVIWPMAFTYGMAIFWIVMGCLLRLCATVRHVLWIPFHFIQLPVVYGAIPLCYQREVVQFFCSSGVGRLGLISNCFISIYAPARDYGFDSFSKSVAAARSFA